MAEASTVLDPVYRAVLWVGYGGLAGSLAFLLLVWPEGVRQRRLALVALGGATLMFLATASWMLLRLVVDADPWVPRVEGTAAVVRLAVLAAVAGFFTDLFDGPIRGGRRVAVSAAVLALTATVLVGAAAGSPGQVRTTSLTGNVYVAVAALVLGGCVVLASVILPGDARQHSRLLAERCAPVGRVAVCVVLVAAVVHAFAALRTQTAVPLLTLVVELALLLAVLIATGLVPDLLSDGSPDGSDGVAALWAAAAAPAQPPPGPRPRVRHEVEPHLQRGSGPAARGHVVVLPDTQAAARHREEHARSAGRANLHARHVAGVGRLYLPDPAEATPSLRVTVRVAGATEPLLVVLPDTRSAAGRG